jgi:hypothetical protein
MTAENSLMRKARWLTQALILSGTLNIGLLATFAYVVLREKDASVPLELKAKAETPLSATLTNASLLKAYSVLTYPELLLRLDTKELVEEGLCKRDLALSCLVAFHHFNCEKAIGALPQKRSLLFTHDNGQEKIELPVYPGLQDDQFKAILHYAKTEKWPLNSQGLFYELQRSIPREPSLIDAFCLTTEFETAQALFSKTGTALPKPLLIELLCEGNWKTLSTFTSEQRQALDLSVDTRRAFLCASLAHRSKTAAKLLLETETEFLLKRCDDTQILTFFDLCDPACPQLEPFATALLVAPRSDAVLARARAIAKEPQLVAPVHKRMYTIENGDSLWKIARKFHVSVDTLIHANHLETERLRAGKQLIIPETTQK